MENIWETRCSEWLIVMSQHENSCDGNNTVQISILYLCQSNTIHDPENPVYIRDIRFLYTFVLCATSTCVG